MISHLLSCVLHSRDVDQIQLIFESYVSHLLYVRENENRSEIPQIFTHLWVIYNTLQ